MAYYSTSAALLGEALKAHGYQLALAESCTGGMLSQMLTSIAGSSAWFDRGFVTYSNAAKQELLGISAQTLDQFGAVSEQTAAAMANGALTNSHANIAGSITGIAGPDGGSAEKPVGTVCFAWVGSHIKLRTTTQQFSGNRDEIRQQAAMFLLEKLLAQLNQTNSTT